MFNEQTVTENGIIDRLKGLSGVKWTYCHGENLPKQAQDIFVDEWLKDALCSLNPDIANQPDYADEVIYKLRTVILSVQPHNLVTQNEQFKKMIFEENSYPFGKDGRMVPIRFFGALTKENLALNEYVVTNQWVFPKDDGGPAVCAARGVIWETIRAKARA